MADFGISGVKILGSNTRKFISQINWEVDIFSM
jgi:hypothetical protein